MTYCFINGEYAPITEAKIGVTDLGLLRSYAVFDYLRTYNGKLFRLEQHMERLRRSADSLHLKIGYTNQEIENIILKLAEMGDGTDFGFRILVTGGYGADSVSLAKPNVVIVSEELPSYKDEIYTNGVKLVLVEHMREVALSKTTDYLHAIKLDPFRIENEAFDLLYHFDNKVLESSRNNVFIIKGGVIATPKDNVLAGITRGFIIELAKANGFELVERAVSLAELADADELFITGTSKKVIPVRQIDAKTYASPGPVTAGIMAAFDRAVADY